MNPLTRTLNEALCNMFARIAGCKVLYNKRLNTVSIRGSKVVQLDSKVRKYMLETIETVCKRGVYEKH